MILQRQKKPISVIQPKNQKALALCEGNVAFKFNYCDGGQSQEQIGFNGACSDRMIRYNIEDAKHVWCSQHDCDCMQYYHHSISRSELDNRCRGDMYICYESQLLRDWRAMAGYYHNGQRAGEPMRIKKAKLGGLCVLTSRTQEDTEAKRFVFGVFLADKFITEADGDSEYVVAVESLSEYRLKFSENQARQLLFWKYHSNENDSVNPRWGSGLHRYISDAEAVQILRDAVEVKRGTHDEKLAQNFLEYFCSIQNIDSNDVWEPNGALTIAK